MSAVLDRVPESVVGRPLVAPRHPIPAESRRRRAAWVLVTSAGTLVAALYIALVIPAPGIGVEAPYWLPLVTGLMLTAELAVVHVNVAGRVIAAPVVVVPTVIAFYHLAPADIVVARLIASALALAMHRHHTPLRIAIVLVGAAAATSIGALAFEVGLQVAPNGLAGMLAASSLGAAGLVIVASLTDTAFAVVTGREVHGAAVVRVLLVVLAVAFACTSIAVIAVVFVDSQPADLWALAPPAVVGLLASRSFSLQRGREARLTYLYDCSQILQQPELDDATLLQLAHLTAAMFRTVRVEIIIPTGLRPDAFCRAVADRGGASRVEPVDGATAMARQRLLGPGGLSQHLGRAQLGSTGGIDERIGMVAAVRCADGVAGTVMVADRLDEALPFTTEELRVLETLGSRLGLVADNAALAGELAESADRVHQLADIVQSSEDAIAAIDMDGRITVWNPAAERLFGYETNEIAGRVASDMIPEPERARVRETFRAALAGAPASNVRMAWLRRDGTSVPVSITVSPIRGEDGTPAGASAIVRDETDRRRAEAAVEAGAAQLRRANEAKTRFLAAVAHELRAPLHAIVIAADLVDDPLAGPLTEGQVKDFGATIQASSRHMVRLIDDLSDLARIEAGRMEIRLASLSLDDLLGEVVRSLGGEARSRGVTLSSPDAPSPRVVSDPVRLRQILTNLVGNAIKFTERGGRVWIETDAGRSTVRVTVHDTGIGIREDDLVRAFLPFEQVSRTSRPGAGLGLAISRSLAELHGGTLSVTSRPGVGSSFTLELPRRRAPRERDEVSLTAGSAARGADRAGRVIAVVDDDSDALRLVAGVLRTVGYDVRTASSLAGARVILRTVTPDLMLLDLRLGDGNGLDLIRDIRSDPARRELPILVVSADTGSEMVASARVAGGDGFLAKPVRPRELLARVRDLAGHDRGEATAAR